MDLFLVTRNGLLGAFQGTHLTPGAGLLIHLIVEKGFADPGGAFLVRM